MRMTYDLRAIGEHGPLPSVTVEQVDDPAFGLPRQVQPVEKEGDLIQ